MWLWELDGQAFWKQEEQHNCHSQVQEEVWEARAKGEESPHC